MDKARLFKVAKDSKKDELFSLYCEQINLTEKLQAGLMEALDWNWLDDDAPKELFDKLFTLAST